MTLSTRIARHPGGAPAIEADGRRVGYGELAAMTRVRAAELARLQARYVLLDHPRGLAWIVDLLAAWEAGRVPVLVDPADPPARRAHVLAQLEGFEPPEGTAYLAFTSGSSGTPTGVALGALGLERMVDAQIAAFELHPGCRAGWMLHPGFDASLSDVLTALVSGATLVVEPADASDLDWLDGLTHIDLPPALLPALLARGVPARLGTIVFGGEMAAQAVVRRLAERRRLFNLYGPTETTICSSLMRCTSSWRQGEIGTPIPGTDFHLEGGELWICGDGVALASLEPHDARFAIRRGQRAFRTGDRVELRDATFTFLGRLDRQVQIRGKRVQLEAVEAVMQGTDGVVAARATIEGGRLVATYEGEATLEAVGAELANRLRPHERPELRRGSIARCARFKATDGSTTATTAAATTAVATLLDVLAEVSPGVAAHPRLTVGALGLDSVDRLTISTLAQRRGLRLEPADLRDERTIEETLCLGSGSVRGVEELRTRALAELARIAVGDHIHSEASGILISGASGLLGAALLDALAALHAGPIHCLVRTTAPHRSLPTVEGDVSVSNWGLSAETLAALRGRIGHVVHLAGRVDLTRGYEALAPVNVRGTTHAVAVAQQLGARLHHASSLSVFAESEALGTLEPKTPLEAARSVRGGYAQTKWVAEAVVRAARLDGTVTRLGLLVADAPGHADQLSRVVRGLRSLGDAPASFGDALSFDCTPVRDAGRALARIIVSGRGTYHLANPAAARARDLIDATGLPQAHPWPTRTPSDADEAVAVAAFRRAQGDTAFAGDLFLATDRRFVCSRAWALAGGEPPAPSAAFLRSLVRRIGGPL